MEFIRKSSLFNVSFNTALPYPKTALWEFVQEKGHFLNDDYTKFHHFSHDPVFETVEFSKADRINAIKMARKFELMHMIKNHLKIKGPRLYHEIKEYDTREKIGFIYVNFKAILDILLNRGKKV